MRVIETISLKNPTGRKTPCHVVSIGRNDYTFSYETCIAFRGWSDGPDGANTFYTIRRANHWGPTTGKHFRESATLNYNIVTDEVFDAVLTGSVYVPDKPAVVTPC